RSHARKTGHLDIEKTDVSLPGLEETDGLAAVTRLGHDIELGPGLRELALQGVAKQRLVVGNQCCRAREHQFPSAGAGRSSWAQTPRGSCAVTRRCAARPNMSCRRSPSVD